MQEVWLVFSNVSKKKKKVIFYFYIIINIAYVPCHDSLFFVCVCDSFLHFSIASQKKKKLTIDFFSLYSLFSQIREFALWHFINYAYICTWIHVHGRHNWTELGKTYRTYKLKTSRTYKLKRSIPTCYHQFLWSNKVLSKHVSRISLPPPPPQLECL